MSKDLNSMAALELRRDQQKYKKLLSKGVPSVLARKARYWSDERIREELGIQWP